MLEAALGLGIRHLDTAFNYLGFASHATLARVAGDLLEELEISTKVGFFPDGHSLDPFRLRKAVEQTVTDLGRTPDLVLLHNPERSLDGLPPRIGQDVLATAATVLAEAKAEGLTKGWGISSWRADVTAEYANECPPPDALMTRCGLTVSAAALNAADHLAGLLAVGSEARWGMAPFGGHPDAVAWPATSTFAPDRPCSPIHAAFAAAFHLPEVSRVAVGTERPDHLAALVAAAQLRIDTHRVAAYRGLLAERKATVGP